MKSISIFNNKGGVGKTTLTFHLAHALAEMNYRVLIVDLDPQCNLTILCMDESELHNIWQEEDGFIDDYKTEKEKKSPECFNKIISDTRSIHFLLKPVEDGVEDLDDLPKPFPLGDRLDLIPGRLTMHLYEDTIARRWSDVYQGDPLAIRTVAKPREIAEIYAKKNNYDFVIMDTSPSLGTLNKVIISTTDGFLIPCMPDMFSLYGVRNIGNSLSVWKKQFDTIYHLLSDEKRRNFPEKFVRLLGYTIYNAKKYSMSKPFNLASAHYNYVEKIPFEIKKFISKEVTKHISDDVLALPVGGDSVMHTHNTLPAMAQKYHVPMWKVPEVKNLDTRDKTTIMGNSNSYKETKEKYKKFAENFLGRINFLD